MDGGDQRHGKEPVAAEENEFPVGMRVLAVDDDLVSRKVLEASLRYCKYKGEPPNPLEPIDRSLFFSGSN